MTDSADFDASRFLEQALYFLAEQQEHQNLAEFSAFTDLLPPPVVLIPLLFDWAMQHENLDTHPWFDGVLQLLDKVVQDVILELRNDEDGNDSAELLIESVSELMQSHDYPDLCENVLDAMARLDFPLPDSLIEDAGIWLTEHHTNRLYQQSTPTEGNVISFPQMEEFVDLTEMFVSTQVDNAYDCYESLKPHLYYLPADGLAVVLEQLLSCEHLAAREAAVFALLHHRRAVSDTALSLLTQKRFLTGLGPQSLHRLVIIRNWLPTQQAGQLDKIIRLLQRQRPQTEQDTTLDKGRLEQLLISVPDGVGAASLFLTFKEKDKTVLAGAVLKETTGIVDSWQTLPVDEEEARFMLADLMEQMPPLMPVNQDLLGELIPHYLWQQKRSRCPMDAALLLWLERLDIRLSQPVRFDAQRWLAEQQALLGDYPAGTSIKKWEQRLSRWHRQHADRMGWFENDSQALERVDQLLLGERLDQHPLDFILGPHREKWCNRVVQYALCSKHKQGHEGLQWTDFLQLAMMINQGIPMDDLPVMRNIAADTISVAEDILMQAAALDDGFDENAEAWFDRNVADKNLPLLSQANKVKTLSPVVNIKPQDTCPCGSGKPFSSCCGVT